jgi:toxic protein SymE
MDALHLRPIGSNKKLFHMAKQTRLVKLHGKYQELKECRNPGGRYVAWLNVSGLWLEQAGFNVGDQVEITVGDETLTIKRKPGHGNKGH